jgi:hypothetical protein
MVSKMMNPSFCPADFYNSKNIVVEQINKAGSSEQTDLNPYTERTLHDGMYLFPTD